MTADLFGDLGAMSENTSESPQKESKTIAVSADNTSDCGVFDEICAAHSDGQIAAAEESKMIAVSADVSMINCIKTHESIDFKSRDAIKFDYSALPSIERIHAVLGAHGVGHEGLPAGLLAAVTQLVAEAQAAPADLPPADRILCWVMDSELAKFAPTRVRRALAELGTNNGERMIPLFAPAPQKGN